MLNEKADIEMHDVFRDDNLVEALDGFLQSS